jgi:hypothetical protein
MRSRWVWLLVAVAGVVAVVAGAGAPRAEAAGGGRPLIHSVAVSGGAGDYTVELRGQGFGGPTVALPYVGDLPNFRIGDEAQPGPGEWGFSGDADTLHYLVWTRSEVEVSGLGAEPGDALVIALWNATTGAGATWGGDVAPEAPTAPIIRSVGFSSLGTPVDLRIVVKGQGFGAAPRSLPFVGDLDTFSFWDGRRGCGSSASFSAGGSYFGDAPADAVTLHYQSWSDTKIVVTGFRGAYGSGCAELRSGDPVAVTVWNSADTSLAGPQAAKRGLILYGIPGN